MKSFKKPLFIPLLAIFALGVPLLTSAQDEDRTWLQVRTVHVKPDRVDDYVELQAEFAAARKEMGQSGRSVWQETRGDGSTFHSVNQIDNLAELDEPFEPPMDDDDWEEWVSAILKTVHSSTRTILRSHRDWSIPAEEDSEPGLLLLRTTTVVPNRMGDYHGWVIDQLIPALKAGGAKGVTFNHTAFGGNSNTWVTGARIDSYGQLQKRRGPLAYMSDENFAALFQPVGEMVTATDLRILRYRTDMSD